MSALGLLWGVLGPFSVNFSISLEQQGSGFMGSSILGLTLLGLGLTLFIKLGLGLGDKWVLLGLLELVLGETLRVAAIIVA